MTSQNIALWALINTQSKGGYSNRKKGRYRKLITITFDWVGIFWWGFQQNNSLKAFYQHPENQEYFKNLYICPLRGSQLYRRVFVMPGAANILSFWDRDNSHSTWVFDGIWNAQIRCFFEVFGPSFYFWHKVINL